MPPGKSTEPVWKTRIVTEWNAARNALDVWVLLEEWDTDGVWLGKRVLGEDGHWREWITVEDAALGLPTQNVPWPASAPFVPRSTFTPTFMPPPYASMEKALALEMEKEFIFGRGGPHE